MAGYLFPDLIEGDSWDGIPDLSVRIAGLPPLFPLATAQMRFSLADHRISPVVELSILNGKITLLSAALWDLKIPKQIIPGLTPGIWNWQLTFTDTAGSVSTYLQGSVNVRKKI
jgi:hypothetical protein